MDSVADGDTTDRPRKLGEVLAGLMRRRGLAERSASHELDLAWQEIAGPEISRHSRPGRLRAGVLEILVTNSAVLERLRSFLHQEILEQVRRRLPRSEIRSIRYVRSR